MVVCWPLYKYLPSPGHERAVFVCTPVLFSFSRRPSLCAHFAQRHHQPTAGGAQLTYGGNATTALGTNDNSGTSGFCPRLFEAFNKEGLNPRNGKVPRLAAILCSLFRACARHGSQVFFKSVLRCSDSARCSLQFCTPIAIVCPPLIYILPIHPALPGNISVCAFS